MALLQIDKILNGGLWILNLTDKLLPISHRFNMRMNNEKNNQNQTSTG